MLTHLQQAGTTDSPIAAIEAAVTEGTSLLLGMWASAGQGDFNNELNALNTAISSYGSKFTSLIAGISVGSEDLYRISPTGIAAREGDGAEPDTLVSYIGQVRSAIQTAGLTGIPIGHVGMYINPRLLIILLTASTTPGRHT